MSILFAGIFVSGSCDATATEFGNRSFVEFTGGLQLRFVPKSTKETKLLHSALGSSFRDTPLRVAFLHLPIAERELLAGI